MKQNNHKKPAIPMEPETPFDPILNQITNWITRDDQTITGWSTAEWQLFKQAAFIHGVAPLLHTKLLNSPLPPDIADWLLHQYSSNQQRVAKIQSDLQTILAAFAAQNVPLMPLKGAVLSAVHYQDIALRPTADIDLLIKPGDFTHSLNILSHLGYEVEKANWKHAILSNPNNRKVVSYEVEHPDNPRRIDLHTTCREMFSGPLVDITSTMWSYAAPGCLLGQPAQIPSSNMLWLHLLLHTSSNIWNGVLRLINLVDIMQLQESANFKSPFAIWKENGPDLIDPRFIYPALYFCRQYFPQSNPQTLFQHCQTAVPRSFDQWLTRQSLAGRSRLHQESVWGYLTRLFVLYRGRPKDLIAAIRFLLRSAF